LQDTGEQVSPDPVLELVRREIRNTVRKSFLTYIAGAVLAVVAVGALGLLFGGSGYPWTGFQEIIAFVVAISAAAVYLLARLKSSKGMGTAFYVLGVLGLGMGGVIFGWGGYSLLSAGYYERQATKNQGCKCWKDGGDIVVVGGESLACLKCSRRIRIGFDVPKLWNRLGLVALAMGIFLQAVYNILPGIPGALFISYLGYLLLFDGMILGILPFSYQQSIGGYVRLPPDPAEPAKST
jgi:hypothetical protein